MTIQEWLNQATANRAKLASLLTNWHPRSVKVGHDMKITARGAEQACEVVRGIIRQQGQNKPNPVEAFYEALDADDYITILTLLNEAWFGVPESTSCWNIEGFTEAVNLMEDPPEIDGMEGHD